MNKKQWMHGLAALALAVGPALAQAGTSVLGFELGVSTAEQVRSSLAQKSPVSDAGTNKFSKGPMLKTEGGGYDIEGLNSVLYIFDEQKRLSGVVMKLSKTRFDAIYKFLTPKYKIATQDRPFVGDQYASFKTSDGVVELSAPHLSFEMEARYLRADLLKTFKAQSTAEAGQKDKGESAKF